jgi:hypothetical protein
MDEKKMQPRKLTLANTKQEMLQAYMEVQKQLESQKELELKPEKRIEEKKAKEVLQVADSLSSEGVAREISTLKIEAGKMLAQISDRLDDEIGKFKAVQNAVALKDKELQELYEIERSAMTLAALIEAQSQKRQAFEAEMADRKEALSQEMETLRAEWKKEKEEYEAIVKERDAVEKKRRDREKEEYDYAFKREQKLTKDRFEDEKSKLEKEIQIKKGQMETELKEREKAIVEREQELNELRKKVAAFPAEMESCVAKAVKETADKLTAEAMSKDELQKKEFQGEKNVLLTRIESLEKLAKEQSERIAKFNQQLEKAYQQVQDVAVKTIEGSSNLKALTQLQQWLNEQTKKSGQEK